jgi:hypothetical protein
VALARHARFVGLTFAHPLLVFSQAKIRMQIERLTIACLFHLMQSYLSSHQLIFSFFLCLLQQLFINTFSCTRTGEHQWPEQSREWGIVPQFAYNMESPQHDDIVGTIKSAKFNFRFDYQLDSEIVAAYFELAPSTLEDSVRRQTMLFKPYLPYEQRHVGVEAAWVAKNCRSSNHREQFVEAVMGAGVRVDSFGGCLHNKDFPAGYQDISHDDSSFMKLLSKYKFYLSFENSNCRHYYSEKLFRSLEIGVIPILLGHPADIEYLLPHKVCELMYGFACAGCRVGVSAVYLRTIFIIVYQSPTNGRITVFVCRMPLLRFGISRAFRLSPDTSWRFHPVRLCSISISLGRAARCNIYPRSSWIIGADRLHLVTASMCLVSLYSVHKIIIVIVNLSLRARTHASSWLRRCQACFMAYDIHVARCVVSAKDQHR